jgi:hypothetical protein
MDWGIWLISEVTVMKASKREIKRVLNKAEVEKNLGRDVLVEIYDAEARVVFMRRRGSILKELRSVIVRAANENRRR